MDLHNHAVIYYIGMIMFTFRISVQGCTDFSSWDTKGQYSECGWIKMVLQHVHNEVP